MNRKRVLFLQCLLIRIKNVCYSVFFEKAFTVSYMATISATAIVAIENRYSLVRVYGLRKVVRNMSAAVKKTI